jgi:ectoine hydroxylase-related dioxygenase (phytanoyl-CoA dioxygenase family)
VDAQHSTTRISTRTFRHLLLESRSSLMRGIRRVTGQRFISAPESEEACRQQYQRDGFVSGGPLIDAARLDVLRREFDRIFAERDNPATGVHYERIEQRDGREYYKIYNLRHHSEAFHDLVTDPRLSVMLTAISGCKQLRLLLDQIQYKPADCGGTNGWHRDMASFPFLTPYTALTAWIPLDDATEDNGAMTMVPESHLWDDVSDIATNEWALNLSRIWLRYKGHWVRRVARPLRAGHVHFHDQKTWHCSPPNRTGGKRRALAIHYFNADARYREGGPIVYSELQHGDAMDTVAPLLLLATRPTV